MIQPARLTTVDVGTGVSVFPTAESTSLPTMEPRRNTILSMVVPTRNEAGNIKPLINRLEQAFGATPIEIIFVDDSTDDTPIVIESMRAQSHCEIRLVVRRPEERVGGLGGAVVTGMRLARSPWVGVMDADLQHPPEMAPQMLELAQREKVDMVIASRYREEGNASTGLNGIRVLASQGSTLAARLTFPRSLRNVTDPMSGFFMARRAALDIDTFQPRGFKILLEILVRSSKLRIAEVGFVFGKRNAGESKASLQEGIRYLTHLWHLRQSTMPMQFIKFLLVGFSGLLVNTLVLAAATDLLHIYYLLSAVIATQSSTLWNFLLTEHWVFKDRDNNQGRLGRMAMFFVMNNLALSLRGPMMYGFTTQLGIHYLVSNLLSLIVLMGIRYAFADNLIWKRKARVQKRETMFYYSIHQIITISSEVWLPELERFMVDEPITAPKMTVRIGKIGSDPKRDIANVRRIKYSDGFGPLGFGIDILLGDTIDIIASPLLRRSPHVLYTNVVEPILRWTFVSMGYALVHGACLAFDGKAFLVTARTDTGKTTTVLRILSRQRRDSDKGSFISDDLTLVSPDGRVMTYPKPLTISHHTVRAVNTAVLDWKEQLALLFQSRIHSRDGRRFAFLLTHTKLPVATINALVQWIVPPPKYHVQRLVPRAKATTDAYLAGMFIIERGGEGDVRISEQEALDTLMQNCDDAYGFPPYHSIKHVLFDVDGVDLQEVERGIVMDALSGLPTTVIRSTKMDWSDRITAILTNSGPVVVREEPEQLKALELGGIEVTFSPT